jgi:selenocysteine lyase/cysteine desulfurase
VALTRKQLLGQAGLAAGAAVLGQPATVARAEPDLRSWKAVRGQFALAPGRIHLSSFLLAAHPAPVRSAIERHRRGLDADPVGYLHAHEGRLDDEARATAAQYLSGSADAIALTDSTTMGLALLYRGLRLGPRDEVLTTEHDFYSTHESLRLARARVRRVRLYDDPAKATVVEIVARLARAVGPRTRVVALTWVHSSTGVKLPLDAIASALPDRVLLCVDGVHGFGVENATVAELGCDALASGCHKWLHGPRGTGILWTSDRVRELLRPTIPSFDDGESFRAWFQGGDPAGAPDGRRLTPGGFHSFEHRWALSEAFRFHSRIGPRRIEARVHALAARLKVGLAGLPQVRLRTPRDPRLSAGIVCFDVDGFEPREIVERLAARRIVASVTPYAHSYVRLGPGIVNSEADIDAAVSALRALRR